jgi:Reverse transcriptase (RNA-dependent DNA polymerase)
MVTSTTRCSNVFLYGDLNETIYMHQPPGFIDSAHPTHVRRLSKALYGLKQSTRAWFHTLSSFLISLGFHASKYDSSLFVLHRFGNTIILLVYVDDIIITDSHTQSVQEIISQLQTRFAIKNLGALHYFLGIKVTATPRGLHLSQHKYIQDLLARSLMLAAKPMVSPMASSLTLSSTDGDPLPEPALYRTIVGAL